MYKVTVPTIITNGHFNKEKTLSELKRCGGHRVALALDRETEYTFSSPENLKLLKELVKYYHDNGIEVLVWLGETFGHEAAEQTGESKYTNIRTIENSDKITDTIAFCPLDNDFKSDFCKWVKDVAACEPDMIMLDDDFRLSNRGDRMGCCCDKHMQRINEKLGVKISVSNLKNFLFDGGKNKYRDAWLETQRESMEEFASALRTALDEVNPTVRLGFCACVGSWDPEGWDAAEVARIMAGNTKPFLRTLGAPYWATFSGKTLGEMIEVDRSQLGKLPDGEVFTEGDTYPRPRSSCPAAYLECFDMIMRADGRSDGILKYMFDYVSDADYETGYVDAMVKNEQLYKEIEIMFDGGKCSGVRPYIADRITQNAEYDISRGELVNEIQTQLFDPTFRFITDNSLQSTYENGYVNILFGENARYISKEELGNGNIIDISAAKILMERGIDVGIEKIISSKEHQQKGFTDLPQEHFFEEDIYVRLRGGVRPYNIVKKDGTRSLTEYVYGHKIKIDGDFEYENAEGMRFRVFNFNASDAGKTRDWLSTYAKRRSIVKSIKWLGRELDVYPDGNYPELYIITKKKDSAISVGLWNLFADKIEKMRLKINAEFKNIRFVNCSGHLDGDTLILDSVLYPYEFAGFELEF